VERPYAGDFRASGTQLLAGGWVAAFGAAHFRRRRRYGAFGYDQRARRASPRKPNPRQVDEYERGRARTVLETLTKAKTAKSDKNVVTGAKI